MTEFRMPSLGADMEAATLVEWKVAPGERVKRGDIVAVVETQKGAIEIEIFEDGVVRDLVVAPGSTVPVGALLAHLGAGAEPQAAPPVAPAVPRAEPAPAPAPRPAPPPPAPGAIRVTPAARRRAAALGIRLDGLRGTGVEGAICLADLPPDAPRRPAGFDPQAMRRAIAATMTRAKKEIPHYYLAETMDVTAALQRLEGLNAGREPPARLLPAAMLLRAAALAVAQTPELNGFWEEDAFRPGDGVHIGWAVSLRGGGLVAPAIRDADRLSLDGLMAAMRDLVARARGGGLRGSELTGPTITVTSLGERGAESVLPIIHPPQVAMLGFGRVVERPWVVEGAVVPRRVVTITLAGDHRASDGHRGGLLLARIAALLQKPEEL